MSKRNISWYIFATLHFWTLYVNAKDKSEVVPAIALHLDYISLEKSLWDFLNHTQSKRSESSQLDKIFKAHSNVVSENYTIDFELVKYSVLLNNHEWPNNVTEDVNYNVWSNTVETLVKFEGLFKYFRGFLNRYFEGEYDKQAILDLCRDVLDDNENSVNIPGVIDQIQRVMLKLYHRAMLTGRENPCLIRQSVQQFIYSLYTDIALTELKGYMLMQFSWMTLQILNKESFANEAISKRREYEERTKKVVTLIPKLMATAKRNSWICDPAIHVKNETYDEVTRLLQGFIENEVNLNQENTCTQTCDFYEVANGTCTSDKEEKVLFCARQKMCYGTILDCRFVDKDMSVCLSDFKTRRRYDYIQYENGRVLGTKGKCLRPTIDVESTRRYLFWKCSYCFCICDEQGLQSDRFFNLRETNSDVGNNMVVTGVRMIKKNRVFHLQIQEGQLLPRGQINPKSIQWKPVEDYRIYDRDVKSGTDFFTMDHTKRQIDLDDIIGDHKNDVVIGVKFRAIGTHLNLEVKFCRFDFSTGKLLSPKLISYGKSNDNNELSFNKRTELMLNRPDIPILSPATSIPTSKHNQFIKLTFTDMEKDAAQTTVPFIDTQPVAAKAPLSGIGIYHKGRQGFGGFLAPSIFTYDFTSHIQLPNV
ncbi:hypothetical protein ACFFRR_001798 [Megaselia abdita]